MLTSAEYNVIILSEISKLSVYKIHTCRHAGGQKNVLFLMSGRCFLGDLVFFYFAVKRAAADSQL